MPKKLADVEAAGAEHPDSDDDRLAAAEADNYHRALEGARPPVEEAEAH